jgi:hypothetical protein
MSYRARLYSSTALAAVLSVAAAPAIAADFGDAFGPPQGSLPAVSAPNGKFDLRGGSEDGLGAFMATGSFSVPIDHAFGFQADAMAGSLGGEAVGAIGAHLFWRDPATGLLGIYGDVGFNNSAAIGSIGRVAAEGELYLDRVTLSAVAGGQFGDSNGFFDKVTLSFYPSDDLELYIGHRYLPERGHFGAAGFEFLTGVLAPASMAVFAEGRVGESGYAAGYGGIRFYFGPEKSLIRRHREDDPTTHFDLFMSAASFALLGGEGGGGQEVF